MIDGTKSNNKSVKDIKDNNIVTKVCYFNRHREPKIRCNVSVQYPKDKRICCSKCNQVLRTNEEWDRLEAARTANKINN